MTARPAGALLLVSLAAAAQASSVAPAHEAPAPTVKVSPLLGCAMAQPMGGSGAQLRTLAQPASTLACAGSHDDSPEG